jgi:hypothetical protein
MPEVWNMKRQYSGAALDCHAELRVNCMKDPRINDYANGKSQSKATFGLYTLRKK